VLLLYEAKRKVFWTGVRIPPPPPEVHVLDERNHFMGSNGCASDGGDLDSTGQQVHAWTAR